MEVELVRTVVRAFYGTEPIIMIDALVNHSALTAEDCRYIMINTSRSTKDVGTSIGELKKGGLVSSYFRQEHKPGNTKAHQQEYYFIDYRYAIDATKYRLHTLEKSLAAKVKPTAEKNEFTCPQCSSQWTLMDALDNIDPEGNGSGFLCKTCGHLLEAIPEGNQDELDHNNPLSRFNRQFDWLIKMLAKIDKIVIPESSGEKAVENKRDVPRPAVPGAPSLSEHPDMQPTVARPSAVVGLKAVAEKVEITLTTEEENTAAAQHAEAERRAKVAAQNQLPSWHTESTVQPGSKAGLGLESFKAEADDKSFTQSDAEDKNAMDDDDAVVAAYRQMEEQKRLEEIRKQEEEDAEEASDDEEDEDDFEDVEVSPPEAKKRKLDDTDSAKGTDSMANTPIARAETGTPANGDESDEDEEFEEVV
jgi:transcription initiation factor TFIIE subunit alpha